MYCVKYGETYLAWTLAKTQGETEYLYDTHDPNAGWAKITGSAKVVPVTVIIMEKGSITE